MLLQVVKQCDQPSHAMATFVTPMARNGTLDQEPEFIFTTDQLGRSYSVHEIAPRDINLFWQYVAPLLEKVSPHSEGELTPDDFLPFLKTGEMTLWIGVRDKTIIAAMVTQVIPYPKKNVLRIISLAGSEIKKYLPHFYKIEDWARERHCKHIELWGRKGWQKILKDWKNTYQILTKEL